jgi:hypothetical protein
MKAPNAIFFRTVLPLPAFVLHPLTAVVIAAMHVYLAFGHLSQLIGGDVQMCSGHTFGRASARWAEPTSSWHWRRAGLPAKKVGTFTQALRGRGEEETPDDRKSRKRGREKRLCVAYWAKVQLGNCLVFLDR